MLGREEKEIVLKSNLSRTIIREGSGGWVKKVRDKEQIGSYRIVTGM